MKIKKRNQKEILYKKHSHLIKFLYNTFIGRCFLKLLTNKYISKFIGYFLNSKLSIFLKNKSIKNNNIDMSIYEDIEYNSYNKFFTRKIKKEYLNINQNKNILISPCDSKLMILKINEQNTFKIKNSLYKLEEIINDSIIDDYRNGYLLIFRLEVDDYHRYCFIDDGKLTKYHHINGILHTVQPIVYDHYKVFHRNTREWTILKTNNFDNIIQVEVGAILVGKIVNDKKISNFHKGDEKGYFEFGGSTILLFIKNNIVDFDEDILDNSQNDIETIVKYGERIGVKKDGRNRKTKNRN